MPTNRRRMPRTRRAGVILERSKWADWAVEFGAIDSGPSPFNGDVHAAEAYWREFGESILAEHIERSPGSRPWAWWEWTHRGRGPEAGEDQAAYLARRGLLTAEEREALEQTGRELPAGPSRN